MRGGTENVYGIVGLAKALEKAYLNMDNDHRYIQGLKTYMIDKLKSAIPGIGFNGEIAPEKSLYTVLNVLFPETDLADMLIFNLDISGISVSGGSACSSGTNIGSQTNSGGEFQINIPQDGILIFSSIGFITQEATTKEKNFIKKTDQEFRRASCSAQ